MEVTIEKTTLQTYSAYKDSGVEWLGEIPEHWEILPGLSFIFENKDRNKGMIRNTVLSLSYGKIRVKGENELTGLVPESFETYQFVNKGDLIFRPTDLQNDTVSLRSSISEYEGIITNAYLNLRFRPKADSKFYHYFFRSIDNNKIIYGLGSGLRQNISYLDFRRFLFPFPPKEEQTAIANFLDDKTTTIDQAIGIKQNQIALLKERRQILIHKAVTRGLNDNVKLKDSGVEWIGEIPEHWEVKKVTHLFDKIGSGTTPTSGDHRYYDGEYNFLQTGDLNDGKIILTKRTLKEKAFKDFTSLKIYPKGSLVMAMYGATIGKLGILNIEAATNQACCIFIKSDKIETEYFFQVLLAFRTQIISFGYGGGQPNISQDLIKSLRFPIAPETEQKQIVEFIETATIKIATAISLKEQEIEKLKEYKMSLIDGVVTGKVRVS
jgi:type I restriction enzyme S subunit